MGVPAYGGIDWGWSNPSTLVVFFIDNRENIYVVLAEGATYMNNPSWAQTIKNRWHHVYRVQLYFPDLANPGDAVTMRTEGLPCPTEQVKDTMGGIQLVKKWLKSVGSPVPKMFIANEGCTPLIKEFQMYHFKTTAAGEISDDVEKEWDHWLDAIRYALYGLFGKSKMVMAADEGDWQNKIMTQSGSFTRMPTAQEYALSKGIKITPENEIDKSKLGEIGKLSELQDDDSPFQGDGSFLWHF